MKVMTLVPWLKGKGEATFGEMGKRFDYNLKDLLSDLMTLSVVGVPPYSPGDLTFINFDPLDDIFKAYEESKQPKSHWKVAITQDDIFNFPPQLTDTEAFTLVAAYGVLENMELDTNPDLKSAIEKIKASLHESHDLSDRELVIAETNKSAPKILSSLQAAISGENQIELSYYSIRDRNKHNNQAGNENSSIDNINDNINDGAKYLIEPWHLFFKSNHWYLSAYAYKNNEEETPNAKKTNGAERIFRVSRIFSFEQTSSPRKQQKPEAPNSNIYINHESDEKIVLELDPSGRWALDLFIADSVKEVGDERVHVSLSIGNDDFLERLLLQIGADGRIIKGEPEKSNIVAKAAKKLLKKYEP